MTPPSPSSEPGKHSRPPARVAWWAWVGVLLLIAAAVWLWLLRPDPPPQDDAGWARQRQEMVDQQLAARDIRNERVLAAMAQVPRHAFVPDDVRRRAYADHALPIGRGQTISQPFIVALMTEAANPQPNHRVLEVGTGSGYQAAVLADLVAEVYTIELDRELAKDASERLQRLGYRTVQARQGDGYLGWPEAAPFDAILVTCGADHVPGPLFEQLKPGGKLVIPVGQPPDSLSLQVITKGPGGEQQVRDLVPVRFVPLRRPAKLGSE